MTSRSTVNSPLTMLQRQFREPRVVARFDQALGDWSADEPVLSEVRCHQDLVEVLATRDYARHDEVLHALLVRAATTGAGGVVATEIVVNAMLPVVPGIVGRANAANGVRVEAQEVFCCRYSCGFCDLLSEISAVNGNLRDARTDVNVRSLINLNFPSGALCHSLPELSRNSSSGGGSSGTVSRVADASSTHKLKVADVVRDELTEGGRVFKVVVVLGGSSEKYSSFMPRAWMVIS